MNNKFEKLINNAPEVKPDEIDKHMLDEVTNSSKQNYILKEDYEVANEERIYNGKIALRIPKTLHQALTESAKAEGVSLNQHCLYKLAQ